MRHKSAICHCHITRVRIKPVGMKRTGYFLTFEGGEGSGKTTQLRRLANAMQQAGRAVRVTREPGGTPAAEALRHALLSGEAKKLGPLAEASLFASARADHVEQFIKPALAAGNDVLCDRFIHSTRAYQGGESVDRRTLDLLEEMALFDLRPDLTLLLDLDVEQGMARADTRRATGTPDRFEADRLAEHERRRRAFLAMAQAEPDRFLVIDASQPPDLVEKSIRAGLAERLSLSFATSSTEGAA